MDKPLPDKSGVLLDMFDENKFSRDALARFPTLEPRLREGENLLHVQMAVLADAARKRFSATISKRSATLSVL